MYEVVDRVIDYVLSKGLPLIILLVVIYLIYRYYVYGQGNKTILCPSFFGTGYNNECLSSLHEVVDLQGNLIKTKDLI